MAKKAKPKQVEDCIQIHLLIWVETLEQDLLHFFHHSPNGGSRNKLEAYKFKKMGVRAGIPDIEFYLPEGKTLFLELKKKDGKLSKVQKIVHAVLKERGHIVLVAYGMKDAQEQLIKFQEEWYGAR